MGDLSQATKDCLKVKLVGSEVLKEYEEDKMEAGLEIIIKALQNKKKKSSPDTPESDKGSQGMQKRVIRANASDGMIELSKMMKDSDSTKFLIEREKIKLEMGALNKI